MLDWKQEELAGKAGLSLSTVVDYERKRRTVSQGSVDQLAAALRAGGVQFIDRDQVSDRGGVGVRLTGVGCA